MTFKIESLKARVQYEEERRRIVNYGFSLEIKTLKDRIQRLEKQELAGKQARQIKMMAASQRFMSENQSKADILDIIRKTDYFDQLSIQDWKFLIEDVIDQFVALQE